MLFHNVNYNKSKRKYNMAFLSNIRLNDKENRQNDTTLNESVNVSW